MKLRELRNALVWRIAPLGVAAGALVFGIIADRPLASPTAPSSGNGAAIESAQPKGLGTQAQTSRGLPPKPSSEQRPPAVTGLATPGSMAPPPIGAGMTVSGILEGNARVAIIRAGGETFIAKVGEPVGDAVVVAILPTKVILKKDKTTFELPAPSSARTPPVLGASPAGTAPHPAGARMTVTGILYGNVPTAIIQADGQTFVVRVGELVGDARVVSILPTKVVLMKGKATLELPAPSIGRAPSARGAPARITAPLPARTGMMVTGILEGKTRVAIIRAGGEVFITRVGEPVGDAVVAAILPGKVVLKRGGATFDLLLGREASI